MEIADVATALAMVAIAASATAVAIRKWPDEAWRRYIPTGAVTVVGVLALVGFFRWVFEVGTCDGRGDLACITNANQGLLTFLALLLAVAALWTEALSRAAQEKREATAVEQAKAAQDWDDEGRANRAVDAALAEMHHNLVHIALAYERQSHLINGPPWELSLSQMEALRHPALRHLINDDLVTYIDPLQRILIRLEKYSDAIRHAPSPEAEEKALAAFAAEPEPLRAFICEALRFFCRAWITYSSIPACRWQLERPGLEQVRALAEASGDHGPWSYYRTSEVSASKLATLRAEKAVVACWFDDTQLGLSTYEFGPAFIAACSTHAHE